MTSSKLVTSNRNSDCYYITIPNELINDWKKTCKSSLIISLLTFFLECLMEIELALEFDLDRGEHDPHRVNSRNGYLSKTWHTLIGEITLPIPKLRHGSYHPFFQSALDSLGKKRDKFAIFSYVCGITTRYIRPLFELVNIKPMDKSAVSRKSKNYLDHQVKKFRKADLSQNFFPILCLDALYETVRINNVCQKAAVIVITGIDILGQRSVLDVQVRTQECKETYLGVLQDLKKRGLKNPDLIISDAHIGIKTAIAELFPGSLWQRCSIHFIRETLRKVRPENRLDFYLALHKIYNAASYKESQLYLKELNNRFVSSEAKVLEGVNAGIKDTLTFLTFPRLNYHKIYSSNLHERLNRSIRKRTKISEQFPNQTSYVRLVISWILFFTRNWIDQPYLKEQDLEYLHDQFLKKQKQLEEELGKGEVTKPKSPTGFKVIYLTSSRLKLSTSTYNSRVISVLAVGSSHFLSETIVSYQLLTGLDDSKKIETFITAIKDFIDGSDYLLVLDQPLTLLDEKLLENFDPKKIQYNFNRFLPILLSYFPAPYRSSVKENLNELIKSESFEKATVIFNSLTKLWRPQLPKLTRLFEDLFPFFFRFETLALNDQILFQNRNPLNKIKKLLFSYISTDLKHNFKNLITIITNGINCFNNKVTVRISPSKNVGPKKNIIPDLPLFTHFG